MMRLALGFFVFATFFSTTLLFTHPEPPARGKITCNIAGPVWVEHIDFVRPMQSSLPEIAEAIAYAICGRRA